MFVAGETIKSTVAQSQASVWMLALFLLGLAAMAYLTVREASLYETRTAIRNLRRRRKPEIPEKERLSRWARMNYGMKIWLRGPDFREVFRQGGEADFKLRLRDEIDRMVGKAVYHGQKEQL